MLIFDQSLSRLIVSQEYPGGDFVIYSKSLIPKTHGAPVFIAKIQWWTSNLKTSSQLSAVKMLLSAARKRSLAVTLDTPVITTGSFREPDTVNTLNLAVGGKVIWLGNNPNYDKPIYLVQSAVQDFMRADEKDTSNKDEWLRQKWFKEERRASWYMANDLIEQHGTEELKQNSNVKELVERFMNKLPGCKEQVSVDTLYQTLRGLA